MVLEDFETEFERLRRLRDAMGSLRSHAAGIEACAYDLAAEIETVLVADLIRISAEIERVTDLISRHAPRDA